jgi:hypothetical protein
MASPTETMFVVRALGTAVELRCGEDHVAQAVRRAWRDAQIHHPGDDTVSAVSIGSTAGDDIPTGDVNRVLHDLSPAVTRRAIAAHRGELVMLHAAALADPDTGAAAVLVARSGTGKTTACRALANRFAYLSDETAAITRAGAVLAYRKPLSVLPPDGRGHLKKQIAPSALGLRLTDRECHIAALVLLDRDPTHTGQPIVEPLATVAAIAAIAPETSYLPSLDHPLQRLAEVVRLAGGAHRVTYAEAATLEPVLSRLLRARPR